MGCIPNLTNGGNNKNKTFSAFTISKDGRNPSQCAAIDYLTYAMKKGGCLGKKSKTVITDEEYVKLIKDRIDEFDIETRSLQMLGIEKSEVKEVKPLTLGGYDYDSSEATFSNEPLSRLGVDLKYRSSRYQVTKIYGSRKQIYLYQLCFDMTTNEYFESTHEFFYQDVVDFYVKNELKEFKREGKVTGCLKKKKGETTFDFAKYSVLYVGGIACKFNATKDTDLAIKGLRTMYRSKKGTSK